MDDKTTNSDLWGTKLGALPLRKQRRLAIAKEKHAAADMINSSPSDVVIQFETGSATDLSSIKELKTPPLYRELKRHGIKNYSSSPVVSGLTYETGTVVFADGEYNLQAGEKNADLLSINDLSNPFLSL